MPGIVVLDTSCVKHLRDRATRRISANLRAADLRLIPSVLNLFEIAKNRGVERQGQLETLAALAGSGPLLPWPMELLRDAALFAHQREPGRFPVPQSGFEWAIREPAVTPELEARARQFMERIETIFDGVHADSRRTVQAELRKLKLRGAWPDARDFLDSQWHRPHQVGYLVRGVWEQLGLPGRAPVGLLLDRIECWRLAMDGYGFSVFERAVMVNEPKRVSRADLLQLVYLGDFRRRILVSADNGLLRAGRAILDGRYPGARTMSWEEFAAA
jgi:hypothetical protein